MKKHHLPLIVLIMVLFLLAGVAQVSARTEVPGGIVELRRDKTVTSELMDDEGNDIEPAIFELPDGAEGGLRRGVPARVEQTLPLQVQERSTLRGTRQARSAQREEREEKLRSMNRSDRARERMSDVAKSVEELLANPEREGGIGKDIREIARQHQDSQGDLEENLGRVNSRNRFVKFIVGTDRKALIEIKKETTQIDGRIAKLNGLLNTVEDETQQAELNTLIEDLEGQRNDLLETVEIEDSSFSMVGWIRRLFGQTN